MPFNRLRPEYAVADWRNDAACRNEDPEMFFPMAPSDSTMSATSAASAAKSVCQRCPVVHDCLTWALDSGQRLGVWGGMSELERRTLMRQRRELRLRLAKESASQAAHIPSGEVGRPDGASTHRPSR